MYKYQNVSDTAQSLVGVGMVAAGQEIAVEKPIENPNFKYVGQSDNNGIVGVTGPTENAVNEASLVDNQNRGENSDVN